MRAALLPAVAATLCLAAPAAAQQAEKVASEPTKMVCKRAKATGTRLGNRRVCATEEQWRQREKDDQELLNKIQAESRLQPVQ